MAQIPIYCTDFQVKMRSCSLVFMEYNLRDIDIAARWLAQKMQTHRVVALHGVMGAGKTTLTAALLTALGSSDHAASPTYSIINQYQLAGGKKILHMDWYRLKDEQEAIDAGVEDALQSDALCVVEWPEKADQLLPDNTLHVTLSVVSADERRLDIA